MNIWTSTNNFKKLYSLPSVSEQVTSQSSFHAYWIRNKTSEAERSTPLHDIFTLFRYSDKFQGLPERLLRRFASFASYSFVTSSALLPGDGCALMEAPREASIPRNSLTTPRVHDVLLYQCYKRLSLQISRIS